MDLIDNSNLNGNEAFLYAIDKNRTESELRTLYSKWLPNNHLGIYGIVLNPNLSLSFLKEIIDGEYSDIALLATKNDKFKSIDSKELDVFKKTFSINRHPLIREFLKQEEEYKELINYVQNINTINESFETIIPFNSMNAIDLTDGINNQELDIGYWDTDLIWQEEYIISELGIDSLIKDFSSQLNSLIDFFTRSYYPEILWIALKNPNLTDLLKINNIRLSKINNNIDEVTLSCLVLKPSYFLFPAVQIYYQEEDMKDYFSSFEYINPYIPLRVKIALQTLKEKTEDCEDIIHLEIFRDSYSPQVDLWHAMLMAHPNYNDEWRQDFIKNCSFGYSHDEETRLHFFTHLFVYATCITYLNDHKTIKQLILNKNLKNDLLTQLCLRWNPNLNEEELVMLSLLDQTETKISVEQIMHNFLDGEYRLYQVELENSDDAKIKSLFNSLLFNHDHSR